MGWASGELRKAVCLGSALMMVTSSYTLVKTVRDALFLLVLPASWLPWVYLFVGVVTLAVSVIVGRLTQRLSARRSLIASVLGATTGLALVTLAVGDRRGWVPAIFYLYVNAYGLIVVSQFWLYTNSMSDPREMKRICGIVGGGAIFGGVVGGVLASTLGGWVPLRWLLAIGAGLLALSLPLLSFVARRQDSDRTDDQVSAAAEVPVPLVRVPYVRWLAVATLCSVIVTGLLDYQFKIVVQQLYPDVAQLTSFFGRASSVARKRSSRLASRVFRRLGLLYAPRPMFSAYLATLSDSPRVRANAVEYIERSLSPRLCELVLPLLPGARRGEQVQLADKIYGLREMTSHESLATLVESDDLWLRACALYVVGIRQERDLLAQVGANLASADVRVSETAAWARLALAAN